MGPWCLAWAGNKALWCPHVLILAIGQITHHAKAKYFRKYLTLAMNSISWMPFSIHKQR